MLRSRSESPAAGLWPYAALPAQMSHAAARMLRERACMSILTWGSMPPNGLRLSCGASGCSSQREFYPDRRAPPAPSACQTARSAPMLERAARRAVAAHRSALGSLSPRLLTIHDRGQAGRVGEDRSLYWGRTRFDFPCTPAKTTSTFAGVVPLFLPLCQVLTTSRNESPAL